MTYTYTGVYLISLITFFAVSVGNIFVAFDNIPFFDAPFSILDVFIAILLLKLLSWYILRIITSNVKQEEDNERIDEPFHESYDDTWTND